MAKLTKPTELVSRTNMVDHIISLIEAEFAKNPNFDTPDNHLDKPKKRVEIDGLYDLVDRQAVCVKYVKEAGWHSVTSLTVACGIDNITSFTFRSK